MSKKEQCKAIMLKYLGPNSAGQVDKMSEDECIIKCRAKIAGLLGPDKAKEFDAIK